VAALKDSGAAEGACLLAGEARAPAGGERWATAEVPTAVVVGRGVGGTTGASDVSAVTSLGSESVAENVAKNGVHGNQTMCCAKVVLVPRHIEW
jgi:hypothetical protein